MVDCVWLARTCVQNFNGIKIPDLMDPEPSLADIAISEHHEGYSDFEVIAFICFNRRLR